ncbi:MAG: UDP-N-acetylmuramoyl-L-alanyl-D-glutamate--2,6-diaminopimelate ligase [Aurantimicrobium sp.]|nr:UDP-N-acetylmuramoyl-L-alanyl-D-glutamate--2,6-diaminopimelate ligase [Aurantimicrobium sp.]
MSADGVTRRPNRVPSLPLSTLAIELGWRGSALDSVIVSGVTGSSHNVLPGDVFFAVPGARFHGADYVTLAASAGAVAIVTDAQGEKSSLATGLPVLVSLDPRKDLGLAAALIYGTKTASLATFGVTGTNGKTTVAYLLDALLRQLGARTGLSSTSERIVAGRAYPSGLTTPEADEIHALLSLMVEADVSHAVLEVSAHALTRQRVSGVRFDVVAFTNFSHDHLDDYATMEDYFLAKADLFDGGRAMRGVVCVDDSWGRRLAQESDIPVVTVASTTSGDAVAANWRVGVTATTVSSTSFVLEAPGGETLTATVPLVGDFSATNAAIAIVMLVENGFPLNEIRQSLGATATIDVFVPGRTEIVSGDTGPTFYVDYGHTPEAFARTLSSLRALTPGRLTMVFGADGDRDVTKRADMGRIAATGADVVVITDFHPRTEDPAVIRSALMRGAAEAGSTAELHEIADQREAVRFALEGAQQGDTILYAGPGHEDYQEVNGTKIPYDAREDVRQALREANWPPREAHE